MPVDLLFWGVVVFALIFIGVALTVLEFRKMG